MSDFVNDGGTALVGCWVRDTALVLPAGFPYFIQTTYFPDYLDKMGNGQTFNRRWISQNVTTLTPPLNSILRPMITYINRDTESVVVIVYGAGMYIGKERKVEGKRYETRSRGRSSPDTLAF